MKKRKQPYSLYTSMQVPWRHCRAFLLIILCVAASPVAAGTIVIRDSEMDYLLHAMLDPMLKAAELPQDYVTVQVLHDPTLNAFVTTGNRMFLHTGLILKADSPEMLASVIAHELGHIEGGHIIQRKDKHESQLVSYTLTALLAGLAGVAGGGDAATGVLAAGSQWHMANQAGYSRTQEQAADQAALRYMQETNISTKGMLHMFEALQREHRNPLAKELAYMLSHPLTSSRIAHVRQYQSGELMAEDHAWVMHLRRIQAKIIGFLLPLNRDVELEGEAEQTLVEAIRKFRRGKLEQAVAMLHHLQTSPEDPYLLELEGQFRAESGDADGAIPIYRRALAAMPEPNHVTEMALVGALISAEKEEYMQEAYRRLLHLSTYAQDLAGLWPNLARVSDYLGKQATMLWAQAEMMVMRKKWPQAKSLAEQAMEQAEPGSAVALRAADVVQLAEIKIND